MSSIYAMIRVVFNVPFQAESFPSAAARGGTLRFDESDLAHALFVTGRAPGDRVRFGLTSIWEWVHRSSLVPAYIQRNAANRMIKSPLGSSLDRSEKVGLSYALGQALTSIFCAQNLGVTHLMHVDRYASRWNLTFDHARRRADLFGQISPSQWVVAEAKGRSNGMESSLRRTLIEQKATVRTVAGHRPAVALGCVAHFPLASGGVQGPMRVDAFDPEPDKEAVDLDVTEDEFFLTYYEPFAAAIDTGERTDGPPGYVAAILLGTGLRVGMREGLYDAVRSDGRRRSRSWFEILDNTNFPEGRPDGTYMYRQIMAIRLMKKTMIYGSDNNSEPPFPENWNYLGTRRRPRSPATRVAGAIGSVVELPQDGANRAASCSPSHRVTHRGGTSCSRAVTATL